MPTNLARVNAGDLIRADSINDIIELLDTLTDQVQALSNTIGTGPVAVPRVLGRSLSQARSIVTQPTRGLRLGNTIDAFGLTVDPDLAANRNRVVIAQMPQAGSRVAANTAVDLILAAVPSSGSTPPDAPVINNFSVEPAPIGQPVTIIGANFSATAADNTVTFDGIAAPVLEATSLALRVRVPETLADPPAGASQTVIVTVTVDGRSANSTFDVIPRLPSNIPVITRIIDENGAATNMVKMGTTITIEGANFATSVGANSVSFNSATTPALTAAADQLTVVVPNPGGLPGAGIVVANLVITVAGNESDPFNVSISA